MLDLLKGVTIVEATTIVFGPMAGQVLADLGADVVKLESPDGDPTRGVAPLGPEGMGAMFVNNNRNKRSLTLDLKRPEGKEVLNRLLAQSDVFLHNMRVEAVARLGFDAASAMQRNPRLVYCAAVGFGSTGPYGKRPVYDDVVQAASGLAALPTYVGREPAYVPSIVADKIGALHVVYAIAAALFRRERDGRGCEIEVPMFEAMAAFVLNEHLDAATFDADGAPGYRRMLNPHRHPFRTADGWIAVLPYSEGQWRRTFAELGRDDIPAAAWFASPAERSKRVGDMYGVLAEALLARTTEDWLEVFARLDVPHARVASLADLLNDPHLAATGFFRSNAGDAGPVRAVAQPVTFAEAERVPDRPAPRLGADNTEILTALGYGSADIAALRRAGVLGCDGNAA